MSCEPCIRGHRSTKCTHANERLMVPVRKPGRPLSACPHPRDQPSPPPMHGLGDQISDTRINGYANGHGSLNQVLESPLETPTEVENGQVDPSINGNSCAPSAPESSAHVGNAVTNGGHLYSIGASPAYTST
ncbi:hypothetical protein DID88_006668 [Monilinia fructigena]|uniref:Copper-fist domain-containing protein n=1 Tax=Monilinia fructigena TaxID=38457 RepID=A0A395IIP0_9HELO|nr:hypothetical protein DID88_006668 [Monilinia fructigena]